MTFPCVRRKIAYHGNVFPSVTDGNKLCKRPPRYALAPASWPSTFWPRKWCQESCDMGYLCANFSLPGPLFLTQDRCIVRDRQTDVRRASSLNAPYPRGRGIISHQKLLYSVCHRWKIAVF